MSLQRISIKDFAIVDQVTLDLEGGFTALTGETGAGKSILIDALQLALGDRADASAVREGQSRAEIALEFGLIASAKTWLDAAGIESNGTEVLVRRSVDCQGRSRGWINGTPVTATQLRELGALLVDIHGQHAWQGLMKQESSRELLDTYGHIDTQKLQQYWTEWQNAKSTLSQAEITARNSEAEQERLVWQLKEADKLAPQGNEWENLQEEHSRLANVASLTEAAQTAITLTSNGDSHAIGLLSKAQNSLKQRLHQEPKFAPLAEALEQACILVEDASRDLQAYLRNTEADPSRLDELEHRLSQWMALAKQHRCTSEDLPKVVDSLRLRLKLLNTAVDTNSLARAVENCERAYILEAKSISELRHSAKQKFASQITSTIRQLGMADGLFEVQLSSLEKAHHSGVDRVDFLVAGHAGTAPRPLSKVASGGELSRIALAIAVATSQLGGCPTLIFDEVDSGVGGTVAHTVGQLMAKLGQARQVLAVTHLAQVAARANHHLEISKLTTPFGVISAVKSLKREERVVEVARMLGGSGLTEASFAHAREMLNHG